MKKTLIISYTFPPIIAGGTWRAFKFVKYLPENNIMVDVLTSEIYEGQVKDDTLLYELDTSVNIYRVRDRFLNEKSIQFRQELYTGIGDKLKRRKISIKNRLLLLIRNNILLPDTSILWCVKIFFKTLFLNYKKKYDVIFITSPPFSLLVLGFWIKKILKIKIIIDFRDPWTQWFNTVASYESKVRKRFGHWMEKKVIIKADKVITTTPGMTQYLLKYVDDNDKIKISTIYNGADPEDFSDIEPYNFKKYTIVYTGLLNETFYSPLTLIEVLKDLKKSKPELSDQFQLLILGPINRSISEILISNNLDDIIIMKGILDHSTVIEYILGADLLLLLLSEGFTDYFTISGKLFEYIMSQNEILALIPKKSAAGEILSEYSRASIINPNDFSEITNFLLNWLNGKYSLKLNAIDESIMSKFNRKKQADELSIIIKNL